MQAVELTSRQPNGLYIEGFKLSLEYRITGGNTSLIPLAK
jgi:hypothetical protein